MTDIRLPKGWQDLVQLARAARQRAWAPYSKFTVGAAVQDADRRQFGGCNVENASYGLSICAERVAMCSAVAAGARRPEVMCISLVGEPLPCGSCRQFLWEFNPDLLLLLDRVDSDDPPECVSLSTLLPKAFRLD